jgi:hypothetical protein
MLLLDNFSGHKTLGAPPNNLHIVFFPANVTMADQSDLQKMMTFLSLVGMNGTMPVLVR